MSFDEVEFLTDLKTYLAANVASGELVHVFKDLTPHPDNTMYQVSPPFFCFKDGTVTNASGNECRIDYSLDVMAVVEVLDEMEGSIIGRAPVTTTYGIAEMSEEIQGLITYENLQDGITQTNYDILGVRWTGMQPSVNHHPIAGRNWQSRIINFMFELRAH